MRRKGDTGVVEKIGVIRGWAGDFLKGPKQLCRALRASQNSHGDARENQQRDARRASPQRAVSSKGETL